MTVAEVRPPRRSLSTEASALVALFDLTVRQHTHGRRLLVLVLLYLVPCALAILLRSLPHPAEAEALEFALVLTLLPHGLAPLTALLYAAGVVSDEVEEQTLTYLLLRSIPRWELYLTKLLATLCVTTLLVTTAVLALYTSIYAGTPQFWSEALPRAGGVIAVSALAQVGYCVLFGFLGLVTRRALIGGIAYIVAIEGVLANLDFVGRSLTVVYYVRTLSLRWLDLPAEQLRRCQDAWGMTELDKLPSSSGCALGLLGFGAVLALVSALLFARSEFRVKTPGSD
ncbi:ABC transporter permease [Gemmata sp. G18]|uniref:ABC transporter permease n=1 Tax=Gemmata palustris TaxID=2822762 RepID=A0ABS5BY94_9BACT|nr:ABC transporter permease subunit [Gemmata palustris]MBP3958679.1 ABC transporter permease [Gemmata palustris]